MMMRDRAWDTSASWVPVFFIFFLYAVLTYRYSHCHLHHHIVWATTTTNMAPNNNKKGLRCEMHCVSCPPGFFFSLLNGNLQQAIWQYTMPLTLSRITTTMPETDIESKWCIHMHWWTGSTSGTVKIWYIGATGNRQGCGNVGCGSCGKESDLHRVKTWPQLMCCAPI